MGELVKGKKMKRELRKGIRIQKKKKELKA
jgi:hypothetical protein